MAASLVNRVSAISCLWHRMPTLRWKILSQWSNALASGPATSGTSWKTAKSTESFFCCRPVYSRRRCWCSGILRGSKFSFSPGNISFSWKVSGGFIAQITVNKMRPLWETECRRSQGEHSSVLGVRRTNPWTYKSARIWMAENGVTPAVSSREFVSIPYLWRNSGCPWCPTGSGASLGPVKFSQKPQEPPPPIFFRCHRVRFEPIIILCK